jgi:hypothetical protein
MRGLTTTHENLGPGRILLANDGERRSFEVGAL